MKSFVADHVRKPPAYRAIDRQTVTYPQPAADSGANTRSRIFAAVILIAWATLVGFGVLHHAYWRDEVRALTLALTAPNLFAIPATVHGEGHPALWYILLRLAYDCAGTKSVLQALAVIVAGLGILLYIWRAPFP